MVIAGSKMHPLWQTPILPLLFLLSAIALGFPMVIMESILSSRSFGLKPEMHVLSRLARYIGPLLGIYFAFKLGDMVVRGTYVYLQVWSTESVFYAIEIVLGVLIPLRMFFSKKVLNSPLWLFIASVLVIFGVLLNRINNFIIAYTPLYAAEQYVPSFGEISVTIGFIAMEVLLFRFMVKNFPVISIPQNDKTLPVKYRIKESI
jgi:Ni/Fe-hydrogenase subunit HybB-like protein